MRAIITSTTREKNTAIIRRLLFGSDMSMVYTKSSLSTVRNMRTLASGKCLPKTGMFPTSFFQSTHQSLFSIQNAALPFWQSPIFSPTLFFSTDSKKKKSKSKKKTGSSDATSASKGDTSDAPLQHQAWVKFQQSIAVEGFETGQTVVARDTSMARRRGGRNNGKKSIAVRQVEEALKEKQRITDVGGGHFPPTRYSDEETQRLLEEAYQHIPPRAGPRRSRHRKRQKLRWHRVRLIRKDYKNHMKAFQIRKMQKRSQKIEQVKSVLNIAPDVQKSDKEYQLRVYQQWKMMQEAA